ncbi:tetratricopeptide repeat protein [Streptomyces sp. NPDC052051]|uniref:tetratricopeptide repeat protein n=1 Tax=Streptomyces sp. NPDC052051 TaxID=3154649 RepID=UPI0034332492
MKRRKLWAGLIGSAAVAAGVTVWATQSHSTTTPESKPPSTVSKVQQADALLQQAQRIQDPKEAAGAFRRVLDLDPGNKLAWYGLGIIALRDRKAAEARADFDTSLKIDPKFTPALFSEAVLLRSSEPERAVDLLKRTVAANPRMAPIADLQLGAILAEKGHDDEATAAFRQAVAAEPSLISRVPERFRKSVSPSSTSSHAGSAR